VDRGSIRVDGTDIAEVDPASWRASIAVVFQDFLHYALSATENIHLGATDREPTEEAIREAARVAGIDRALAALPDGYETILSPQFERGQDLSLGQWQRVALARAFFREAPLVVLDEPTASLDARAERELFDTVRDLFRDRTVLLISHRFSTVRTADRIVVLADGTVVEHGTHEELMEADGLYAELFTLQASSYLDPVNDDADGSEPTDEAIALS
jgi:ATP-binding cassette subfamily B protein